MSRHKVIEKVGNAVNSAIPVKHVICDKHGCFPLFRCLLFYIASLSMSSGKISKNNLKKVKNPVDIGSDMTYLDNHKRQSSALADKARIKTMAANDNAIKTYSTKTSAKRGALRAEIANPVFFGNDADGWTFRAAASFSHKELDRLAPARSQKEKPVDIVWNFVAANPDLSRKETIAHLVSLGLNVNMCRTQYHRCKSGWVRSKKIAAIIGA